MSDRYQQGLSILRCKQVEAPMGLARSTINHQVEAGTFPRPVPPGSRAVGWVESDVSNYSKPQWRRYAQSQPRFAITAVKLPTGARALARCGEPHARPWITSLVKFLNHPEH